MLRFLLPVCILLGLMLPLFGVQASHEAETIAMAIAAEIQTGEPIFMDIHAGEWTSPLYQKLSLSLLKKGADLRDNPHSLQNPEFELEYTDEGFKQINLKDYALSSALLVQVNMNIKWQEEVQKSFFSYRTIRHPVYSFETKQIKLPEKKLVKVGTYDFVRDDLPEKESSLLRLRWFEPIVAATAIGSMVFLLWNFD